MTDAPCPLISNPVLRGFHPDPSIVRHDGWIYLVCSTFAWLPGLPVYRSRDLRRWERLPPVFADVGALDLRGCACDDGLYAPGIRHDGRRFLLACTVVRRDTQRFRNFICTSADPARGWSAPIWLPEDMGRIDPTPFIDDDGRVYLVLNDLPSSEDRRRFSRELRVWELDPVTLQPIGEPSVLWHGALHGAATPEGPRLVKHSGWYYLIAAEGGTGDTHAVVLARGRSLREPFSGCPANPLLTHRHLDADEPIRCVGHADLLPWAGEHWWASCLAERILPGHLRPGREAWLTPVRWREDAWPVFAPGSGRLHATIPAPDGADTAPVTAPAGGWLALRAQPAELATLSDTSVLLPARPAAWDERDGVPALVARRVMETTGRWAARVEADTGIAAGLCLYCTEGQWLRWGLTDGALCLSDGRGQNHARVTPPASEPLDLALSWDGNGIHAWLGTESAPRASVPASVLGVPLFAGTVAGFYAQGVSGVLRAELHPGAGWG